MKQLAYISSAVKLMDDDGLFGILKTARRKNAEYNVTGVLLYSGGTFIQVLEGAANDVDNIFSIIEHDPRHKNIIKMIDSDLDKRHFPDWTMGFATIHQDKAQEIAGFLSSTDDIVKGDSKITLVSILKTFIDTNNLVIAY